MAGLLVTARATLTVNASLTRVPLLLTAPAEQRLVIHGLTFTCPVAPANPILLEVGFFPSGGVLTASGVTTFKMNPDAGETIQTTCETRDSADPTAGDMFFRQYLSNLTSFVFYFPERGFPPRPEVPGGGRFGMQIVTPGSTTVIATCGLIFEE